ncbi:MULTISPECIES: hypoxanthine phosphoribosyltransferase [Listeria]|uniref:hypoxanthine phosphoribosyltransferase n=1 Tax=Listeria TaxID=1637 RepID=UPI000B5922D1|nr:MULTISPECIES: hypoxanthine phosphoribosyltransferase [Listeria]
MDDFLRRVENEIVKYDLIRPNEKLLVAVSGGPDSLALLHFLMNRQGANNLVVLHVNHLLRAESDEEADFVRSFAERHNLAFIQKKVDVQSLAVSEKRGIEETARLVRYRFFEESMLESGIQKIALAHHADDQIETILMRLVRGSSGTGLSGIRPMRMLGEGHVIRPFLSVSKKDILAYTSEHKLPFVVDASNEMDNFTRNRFRKHIVPLLEKENVGIAEHFKNFSDETWEDFHFLDEMALSEFEKIAVKEEGFVKIERNAVENMANPLQRRIIHLLLKYLYNNDIQDISKRHIEAIYGVIHGNNPSATLNLPKNVIFRRTYDQLEAFFYKEEVKKEFYYQIAPNDRIEMLDGSVFKMRQKSSVVQTAGLNGIIIDAEAVSLPLVIRNRLPGDRMTLKGTGGTKKLKDIFIDAKIPKFLRDTIPVVTDDNGKVLWVPGVKESCYVVKPSREKKQFIMRYSKNLGGKKSMHNDIQKVLISEEEIQKKIRELGVELTTEYEGRNPLVIGVLKGATPFMTDLIKRVDTYLEMDFMDVSSYGNGMVSSGEVKIIKDLNTSVEGRDVLIVEDIIDSGRTLSYLVDLIKYRKAKSVKLVTLLDKPEGRNVDIDADYVGFIVPNEFVVGYGLDFAERYRNLPYIGVLKPEIYSE